MGKAKPVKPKKAVKAKKPQASSVVSKSIQALSGSLNYKYVEHTSPKEAALALEMLAQGDYYKEVEERTGIGFTALAGLKVRHQGALEERRASLAQDGFQMAEQLRMLVQKKAEMLADNEDELRKVNIKDLVLSNAISQDKAFTALGENKVVIEHRKEKMSIQDAKKMILDAQIEVKEADEAIDVEVNV